MNGVTSSTEVTKIKSWWTASPSCRSNERTTPANVTASAVVEHILHSANAVLPIKECTFLGNKGYDAKAVYNLVKDVYGGDAVIHLNKRGTKDPKKLSVGNPICDAGVAMHKDRKKPDHGRT